MLNRILKSERRNIYLFYLLSIVMNFWFIASNWIYFWTKYMTYGQLGWVDALGFGFALVLEVPSGAIADLLGKRKTILVGMMAGAIGVFTITFSGSLTGIFIGWLMAQVCYAFYSGAAEAVAYDTLVDLKEENNFDRVISKSSELSMYTGALTTFVGGLLFSVNFRLPHILWGMGFALGVFLSYLLVEPHFEKEKFSAKKYFDQLWVGIRELTQTGLRRYIGFFFILIGVYYMYSWGLIRPAIATSFGFYAKEQGIILPIFEIMGAVVVRFVPSLRKKFSELAGVLILSAFMSLGFLLASFPIGYWGIISLTIIEMAGILANPWISIIVNKRIDSKHRATTLSTVALLSKIPYVLIAVTAGQMVEKGQLPIFNLGVGIIIGIIVIVSWIFIAFKKYF